MLNIIKNIKERKEDNKKRNEVVNVLVKDIRDNSESIYTMERWAVGNLLIQGYYLTVIKEMSDKEAYEYWLNNEDVEII